MKLVLMQPYFFPYLGHFDLINKSDIWVVFDTAQYNRRGWMNRNRVLHPESGWQYIHAPVVKRPRATPINQIRVVETLGWRDRLHRKLSFYEKHAPFYSEAIALVRECLAVDEESLCRFDVKSVGRICDALGIRFNYRYLSSQSLELGPIRRPGDWGLEVATAFNAVEYLNAPAGAPLYDPEAFQQRGIKLTIQSYRNLVYECGPYKYQPALSIIDVLMWNSLEAVKEHLRRSLRAGE